MRAYVRGLFLAILPLIGGISWSAPGRPPLDPPLQSAKVVIVSIDGLRADAVFQAETPNIRGLAERGAYTWQAQTILPSNTLPSHVSMLSGYVPAVHKITWDDYLPTRGCITLPTLFSYARAAGLQTTMVVGKSKFTHFKDTGAVEVFVVATRGDDDVANEAVVRATAGFDLMFVHFPDVDLAGHSKQWMSSPYLERVAVVDRAVGRLLEGLPRCVTVILTADHGGRALNHGTSDRLDMTIPWIISGPHIAHGRLLATRVTTVDTAATAAYVLGFSLGSDVQGKPVLEAFLPAN